MVTPKIAYYANSVALVSKYLYHYFQENENSYMFVSKKNKHKLIEQDIKTLSNLLVFFKAHNEEKYIKNLSCLLTNFIKRGLYYGIETKNHSFYNKILSYHKLIDNEYKSLLWGDFKIKKYIIKSFYLRLLIQKTINFFLYH